MYQREIYRIGSPSIPTYVYTRPYESSVSYHYPCQVVVRTDDRTDDLRSDTQAIRYELSEIKRDISELKRQQPSPNYYVVKQDYSNGACSVCTLSSSKHHQNTYLPNPGYVCDRCRCFVEERTHSVEPIFRSETPNSTYHDSYRPPRPYHSSLGHLERRITLNELEKQFPSSSTPVQHSRHWAPPTASKNVYYN
jgi:hypothetical protein